MECDAFKWRWETIFVGYKVSADVLSKHLIMPLICVNHLSFSSTDVVGDLSPSDLEKVTSFKSFVSQYRFHDHSQTVDKVARTARRTLDTHVKNALSKPRLATTMRRITAVFNFTSDPRGSFLSLDRFLTCNCVYSHHIDGSQHSGTFASRADAKIKNVTRAP